MTPPDNYKRYVTQARRNIWQVAGFYPETPGPNKMDKAEVLAGLDLLQRDLALILLCIKMQGQLPQTPDGIFPDFDAPSDKPKEFTLKSQGLGSDIGKCFVCGSPDRTGKGHPYLHNFAAFVHTKTEGQAIVDLFKVGARLDCRGGWDRPHIQVKICACDKHVENLKHLDFLIADGIISTSKIEQAIYFDPAKQVVGVLTITSVPGHDDDDVGTPPDATNAP